MVPSTSGSIGGGKDALSAERNQAPIHGKYPVMSGCHGIKKLFLDSHLILQLSMKPVNFERMCN